MPLKTLFLFRITAPCAIVIWYVSTLSVFVGDGPMWHFTIDVPNQTCKENWWASFLYITNYFFDSVSFN